MFELDLEMIVKIREKRGRKNITLQEAAEEIGISAKTLGLIENEKATAVRKTVFAKLVSWLVADKVAN